MPGVVATGIEILRLPEIVAEMESRQRDDFGQQINVDSRSPLGQLNGSLGEREASIWELAEVVHNRQRLFGAQGQALDDFAALIGMVRLPAAPTTVVVTLAGTPATVVPIGTQFRIDGTDRVFSNLAPATIGGGGTVSALLTALVTGPIVVRAQVLGLPAWVIVTPVSGLTAATNALDGDTGRDVELDFEFRDRIIANFVGPGNSLEAVAAAVRNVAGVTEVRAVENVGNVADVDGRPPHSFEIIVIGGSDAAIAAAIYINKPGGIRAYGTSSVSVVGSDGTAHSIGLTRPTDVNVWIEVDVYRRDGFPDDGDALITEAILDQEPSIHSGQEFSTWDVTDPIADTIDRALIERIVVRLGIAAGPLESDTIHVTSRQRVALDSSRILVNHL